MSKNIDLKSTINLPKTQFSMKANLPKREPEILEWWDRTDVYGRIRDARQDAAPFVLHDGPPYANANIHLGQALNKILKDFVVKSRSMMGHDGRYVPGWDCHGLPIEIKVDKDLGPKKAEMTSLQIRDLCRQHALKHIDVQRKDFRRLGVFWDRKLDDQEEAAALPDRQAIYRTLDRSYESEIVRQLGEFFVRGTVYHGVKPVHWCASCRTALAEAEVEYADRTDPSVYVRLGVRGLEARVPALAGRRVSVVIWTTTPWTLPANLAVTLHPALDYVAVEVGEHTLIVAEGLLADVSAKLGWGAPPVVARFTGAELVGEGDDWIGAKAPVERPYHAPSGAAAGDGVLILGEHVTLEAGTGAVHTAPGHGADDFVVGQKYGLEVFNPVGDDGKFLDRRVAEDWLAGVFVLKANQLIVEDLRARGLLLHDEDYPHSYPHCWRCKKAILFRSTPQWFIAMDHDDLRGKALAQIHATRWIPAFGEQRIAQMVANRPDWCISRQRVWGVPIPAVVCSVCLDDDEQAFVRDPRFFAHLQALFAAEGSDAWFGVPVEGGGHRPYASRDERLARLVPAGVACPHCETRDHLAFHEHIVDVWFESGVSHAAVLGRDPKLPWPADVYLEGHDQYRGWFHSSLLVATHDRGRAPYREVLTHGFTLDAQGRKMSKSLGNVIAPQKVTDSRGAEILRLWVSMIDFLEDMRLSDETLDRNAETYRKIRNTFRFMLGNLDGFRAERDALPLDQLEEIDAWALHQFEQLRQQLVGAYTEHRYHLVYHGLHNFCGVTLSAVYFDILKDRLYTYARHDRGRRSAQTVLHRLAVGLCRLMAPVLCFTAEEIWQELATAAGGAAWDRDTVHAQTFPEALELTGGQALIARWDRLMEFREEANKALELARAEKTIGKALEAHLTLDAPAAEVEFLRSFGGGLHFLFGTSGVDFAQVPDGAFASERLAGLRIQVARAEGDKCDRCWHVTRDVGADADWPSICGRCVGHVREHLKGVEAV